MIETAKLTIFLLKVNEALNTHNVKETIYPVNFMSRHSLDKLHK